MSPPPPRTVDRRASPASPPALWEVRGGRTASPPEEVVGPSLGLLWGFAAVLVALYPLDILILGSVSGGPLAVRVAWSLSLMLYAWLFPRLALSGQRALATVLAVTSSAFFLVLVQCTGGTGSPYFYSVPMLPLIAAVMNPRNLLATVLSGMLGAGGALGLVLWAGGPLSVGVTWSLIIGSATFFATYAASQARKTQAAEAQALEERARREALEQLALSERRRAQSEKLATIGRLATNMVHEINNPLAFIRANVELLREEARSGALAAGPGEMLEMLDEVSVGIERIRQITADLKGFTYMDGEEPTECRLAVAVADAARLASLRLKRVARLRVDVPEDLPSVYAVHRRLAQVLLNLLVNAGDALEGAQVPGAEVRVTGREEGGRVVLLVEDDGPGFGPGVLPRLFEPFFTTKGPELGTGLGLALSREMVEQFGGTLTAENRAEGGARLRMELPLHPPALPQAA